MPPIRSGLQQRAEQQMRAAERTAQLRLEHALRVPVTAPVSLPAVTVELWRGIFLAMLSIAEHVKSPRSN